MAEAYFRHFAGNLLEAASAGTIPAEKPEPIVVAAMAEDGIDISSARPKLINPAVIQRASVIVTMGCDVQGIDHIDEDWGLPDPKGQPIERVRQIRDLIKAKAEELANRLRLSSHSKESFQT
jgi:arsenate reductase